MNSLDFVLRSKPIQENSQVFCFSFLPVFGFLGFCLRDYVSLIFINILINTKE